MNSHRLTRRTMLTGTGLALALPALAAEPVAVAESFPQSPHEAFARLKAGNMRFAAGKTQHAHESADWRKHLVEGQKPFATILGCSDSRVPTELVFDQGFGELFVIRVAGNVIAPDIVGSLEYALVHLQTPLVVILGHEGCGAVTAALQAMAGAKDELPGIQTLIKLIEPGLPKGLLAAPSKQRIHVAVEANVRWSMQQLRQTPIAKDLLDSKSVMLVGAVYELETGSVRFLAES